jgi:hypothetical protein
MAEHCPAAALLGRHDMDKVVPRELIAASQCARNCSFVVVQQQGPWHSTAQQQDCKGAIKRILQVEERSHNLHRLDHARLGDIAHCANH